MPPPKDSPLPNPLEGPGDYTFTSQVHNDTYEAISSPKMLATGKTVLISGASKGIGRSIALSFAKTGASQIAIGARSSLSSLVPELKAAAASANRSEPNVLPLELDVSSQASVEAASKAVESTFGKLDIIVNVAGAFQSASITESDPKSWWSVWEVNLLGPYLVARSFVPLLLKGGDKTIVTVSSVGAHLVLPGLSAYQTSKLAQLRLMEFLCVEYAEQNLLAYCVHPGNVPDTDIMGGGDLSNDLKHIFVETKELCADTLTFLTKEKREWLAGRYINCTWDMPEVIEKEEEIVQGDKLKVRMVV